MSDEYTHIHFIFFQLSWTSLATEFFFLPLDTNRLRGESSFRPEPLGKPPYEPSRVDSQFCYNFKKIYTDIPLELPKDDQGLLLQGFNDVLSPKRDDGKEEIFFHERKLGSPDQKSRCRTCAQACYSPFKASKSNKTFRPFLRLYKPPKRCHKNIFSLLKMSSVFHFLNEILEERYFYK